MMQAHRMICAVRDKEVRIDLPADFPDADEVEVIVLPLSAGGCVKSEAATLEWLRDLWACAPDFPGRTADVPPGPVGLP
jgi:hypothetical protein